MQLQTLRDIYIHELRDLYSAENCLIDAMPDIARKVSTPGLKRALLEHLEQTHTHRNRLDRIFEDLNEKPQGEDCEAMRGLVSEARQWIGAEGSSVARDVGLITAGNRIEHYEMAGYGAARTHAELLGLDEHQKLLQQSLDEEGEADKKLMDLASECNPRVARE